MSHIELTPEIALNVLFALRQGGHRTTAARFAGVRPEILSRWLAEPSEPYRSFRRRVEQAEAAVELRVMTKIAKSRDPRARSWLLERTHLARWGPGTSN